jgi:hypothetical protein
MLLNRESVLTGTTLLAPLVGVILLFVADLDPVAQAAWNGAALAVTGLITAALVAREKLAPAILGFAQALMQILAVFGFSLTAEQTTGVMGFLALAVGMYLRTQVWAKVDAAGQPREPAPALAA